MPKLFVVGIVLAMASSAFATYTTQYMYSECSSTWTNAGNPGRTYIEGKMYDNAMSDGGSNIVGQGITYWDSDSVGQNNALRTLDPIASQQMVDLYPHTYNWAGFYDVDGNGKNDVTGWGVLGEWVQYTLNVTQAGMYDIRGRAEAQGSTATVEIIVDGVSRKSTVATGGYTETGLRLWESKPLGLGYHTVRVGMPAGQGTTGVLSIAGIYTRWRGIPEPMTALLLLAGMPLLCRRRP